MSSLAGLENGMTQLNDKTKIPLNNYSSSMTLNVEGSSLAVLSNSGKGQSKLAMINFLPITTGSQG
jgi:hypothetical protein